MKIILHQTPVSGVFLLFRRVEEVGDLKLIVETLQPRIEEFLTRHRVINLAYLSEEDQVQSCALWYASSGIDIFYLSSLSTLHGSSLSQGGEVAWTINRDEQSWREITGLQGRGQVHLATETKDVWEIYRTKYPFVANQFPDLESLLSETSFWRLRPSWVRLIDNRLGFGHKEEWFVE